jgi:hypothetical protein
MSNWYVSGVMLSGSGPRRTAVSSAPIAARSAVDSSKSNNVDVLGMRAGLIDFGMVKTPADDLPMFGTAFRSGLALDGTEEPVFG